MFTLLGFVFSTLQCNHECCAFVFCVLYHGFVFVCHTTNTFVIFAAALKGSVVFLHVAPGIVRPRPRVCGSLVFVVLFAECHIWHLCSAAKTQTRNRCEAMQNTNALALPHFFQAMWQQTKQSH